MCVLMHSQYSLKTGTWFDKKIACIPIAEQVQAKHLSRNKQRGTYELKNKHFIKALYEYCLLNNVTPVILEKWPRKLFHDRTFAE